MKILAKDKTGAVIAQKDFAAGWQQITVGRGNDNDFCVQAPGLSLRHFALELQHNGLFLRDTGSINGVMAGLRRVGKRSLPVSPGTAIKAGDLTFELVPAADEVLARQAGMRDPRRVRALAAGLLVVLCFLLLLLMLRKERSGENLPRKTVVSAAPLTEQQEKMNQLIQQAQQAYFMNETIRAAEIFNKVLELDPDNLRAKGFLQEIRLQNMSALLQQARRALEHGNLVAASAALESLRAIDPTDARYLELAALYDGENRFAQARLLFDKGDYAAARNILEEIHMLDEARRRRWLRETETRQNMLNNLREAEKQLNGDDAAGALGRLEQMQRTAGTDDPLGAEIAKLVILAENVVEFDLALKAAEDTAAVQSGRRLQANPVLSQYAGLAERVNRQMSALHAQLAGRTAQLEAAVNSALAQAEKELADGNTTTGYGLLYDALNNQAVLEYINPGVRQTAARRALQARIDQYVRETYQRGYILVGMGRLDQAQEFFEETLRLTAADDDYHIKATEQLERIRRR